MILAERNVAVVSRLSYGHYRDSNDYTYEYCDRRSTGSGNCSSDRKIPCIFAALTEHLQHQHFYAVDSHQNLSPDTHARD